MNWREAHALTGLIQAESSLRSVEVDRLGNGEHIVRLRYGGGPFLIWNEADWHEHKSKWEKYLYALEETDENTCSVGS